MRFSSLSTPSTRRLRMVTRSVPMCPDMRMPLNTRDGNAEEPIEPVIWNMEPCDLGPPPKWCRLTTPVKPRPLLVPTTSTNFSPSKMSTSTRSPTLAEPFSLSLPVAPSVSTGTSRMNLTGGRLFLPRWPCMVLVSRVCLTNSTRPICTASYPSLAAFLRCVITQGPALSTVAGRTSPLSSNNCVIPTFLPKIPVTLNAMIFFSAMPSLASCPWLESYGPKPERRCFLFVFLAERLNFDVHTRRQIEFHERIHGLLSRLENIEQALVGANLELLARLLVHVRRTQNAVFVFDRG